MMPMFLITQARPKIHCVTLFTQAMWTGLLHHVCGEHEWALDACHHGPLEESRDKEWINPESVAHQREVVLNDRWIKKVHKYLRFRYINKGLPFALMDTLQCNSDLLLL